MLVGVGSIPQMRLPLLLLGISTGIADVTGLPLLARLVPRDHIGLWLGITAGSASLAAPLGSLLAGKLASDFGLRSLFWMDLVAVVLAIPVLLTIVVPHREPATAVQATV